MPYLTSIRLPTVATITRSCGCGSSWPQCQLLDGTHTEGLHVDAPIPRLAPVLDIVLSRPSDPAHSELGGLTKLARQLFMEAILETNARNSYNKTLRTFPFPPGWSHIRNPLHHLNSFALQEHGRWSVIFPILLRLWLRPEHIKKLGRSFRTLMAIAARFDLELLQYDAVNAFVNADLKQDIYMRMPPGF